jgi:hypothetical protein
VATSLLPRGPLRLLTSYAAVVVSEHRENVMRSKKRWVLMLAGVALATGGVRYLSGRKHA